MGNPLIFDAMKKIFDLVFIAGVALLAAVGCQKSVVEESSSDLKMVSFYAGEIETKTAFGKKEGDTYPTLWTVNDDKVLISLNYGSSVSAEVTPSDDYVTATFDASFEDDESGSYTFYALSPSKAKYSDFNASYHSVGVTVPNVQTPINGSVDETAQILMAKSATVTEFPQGAVALDFTHALAYGKMSLINLNLGEASVSSISLTASDNLSGRYYYYYDTYNEYSEGDLVPNTASPTLTIKTSSVTDVWFACAPVDLSDGGTLQITVNTDKGTYTKKVTFPAAAGNFQAGKVASFKIDMQGISLVAPKEYILVKSKYDLTVDSEVIIASVGYDLAMSTVQNPNNRGQASVTKSGERIIDPGDDVQKIQLVAGNGENTAALKVGDKFLYATGSGNHLRSGSLADNASWIIGVSDAGVATIQNYEHPTYKIRYNSDNSMFSSYTSAQTDVAIYKLAGSGTATPLFLPELDAPVINVTADNETKKITITWTDVENATSYLLECGDESETVASGVQTYTFTMAEYGTYDITVTVSAEGYASAKSSVSVELTDPALSGLLGEQYSNTFYGASITYGEAFELGSMSWTITAEGSTSISSGTTALGKQFGKQASPCTKLTFVGTGYSGGINKVTINSSCASNTGPVISSVKVGGVSMVPPASTALVKGTNTAFVFTSSAILTGDVEIIWTSSVKAGIYVGVVQIN